MLTQAQAHIADQLTTYPALASKCNKTKLVLPITLKPSRLCIVGESLGAEEEFQDNYFVGKAGKLLDKLLKDIGLIRETIHITNVCKVRPPNNDMSRLSELGLSVTDFRPMLQEELSIINPVAILALGRYALETLTSEYGITKWRGSTLPCTLHPTATVIPTLHPSYLQRGQMDQYPYVRNDIKRFAEVGFGTYKPEPPYDYIINPTLQQCLDFLSDILCSSTETCFDIETVAHQRITCVGWTRNASSAICIPFRHNGLHNRWSEAEQLMLLSMMRDIFAKPGLVKIGQNMHYDLHFLLPLLGFPREPLFDTRYAHQLIHPDSKHDLGFLTSIYTNMNYHKDEFKDWATKQVPHDETLWTYNIKDVITTHRIYHGLVKDLKELHLYNFFTGFTMPFRRVIFEMEHKGIRVDTALHTEWKDFIQDEELPIAQDILNHLCGQDINPNSSKQVGEFLVSSLHLPVPRTQAGNYSVDEKTLESLRARYPQHKQIIDQILCVRVLKSKDLGTYLSAKLSADGRMRCSYGYTKTGRLTSSSNHKDEGTNLQNIPKHLRQIFIPEPGHVFVDADLSQAEARVMAYLMRSDKLKSIFKSGKKIHKVVGSWVFEKPEDDLNADEYLLAKKTVHGCVDAQTEVLTPNGWFDIATYTEYFNTLPIMQFDPTNFELSFVIPSFITKVPYTGDMYHLTQGFFDQLLTPTHRIPHWQVKKGRARISTNGPMRDILARDFSNRRNTYKLPLSGTWSNPHTLLSHEGISLLCAIQADLTIRKYSVIEGNFKKAYKIHRLCYLLKKLNLTYTMSINNTTGYTSFYIPKQPLVTLILSFLGPDKTFNLGRLLANSAAVLDTFTKELSFWDGRINDDGKTSWQYYTTNKHNAEVAATVAHLTNKRAVVAVRDNNISSYGHGENKPLYTVSISTHPLADITEMKTTKEYFNDIVYCPTVPTSYFMIRRNGHISITGNSNYRMGVNKFATIIGRPVAEAKALQEKYYSVVPELPAYHAAIQQAIEQTRKLTTCYGRTRIFTGRLDDETFRSGYAQIPQSTVVDTMNIGTLSIWLIKPPDVYIATQTHDSILVSCPPEYVQTLNTYLTLHLETLRELPIGGDILVIPLEIDKPKENWYGK